MTTEIIDHETGEILSPTTQLERLTRQIQGEANLTPSHELTLSLLSAAQHALELATTPGEVKYVRDGLQTLKDIYRRRHVDHTDQNLVAIKVVHADYKLGGMLHPTNLPRKRGEGGYHRSYPMDKNEQTPYQEALNELQAEPTDRLIVTNQKLWELTDQQDFDVWANENYQKADFYISTYAFLSYWYKMRREPDDIEPLPLGIFRVWYADPPWEYGSANLDNYGPAARHYKPLSIESLCAMGDDIKERCPADAVLFLWVTSPLLSECFKVVEAWGFEYKTSFVWDKVRHNFGNYNSVRHEFLLVCTRGSCVPDIDKKYDSVVSIERTQEHSDKPEEFRTMIDALYTHGERIELFARKTVPGWTAWGNEKDGNGKH